MAAGKSRLAKRLAQRLSCTCFDLDAEIHRTTGRSPADWIRSHGEVIFRVKEQEVLRECVKNETFVLSTGGGTPCFHQNLEEMKQLGIVIWLNTPFSFITQRLRKAKADRPLATATNGEIDVDALEKLFYARQTYYRQADIEIQTPDIEQLINRIDDFGKKSPD